jgi:hypothetical protein
MSHKAHLIPKLDNIITLKGWRCVGELDNYFIDRSCGTADRTYRIAEERVP